MRLKLSLLENVVHKDNKIVARCPACAAQGGDEKGEHLFIAPDGRFGCVCHPGADGHEHRQAIFKLVGDRMPEDTGFNVKKKHIPNCPNVIHKDVLGRLGRFSSNHIKEENEKRIIDTVQKEADTTRPARPTVLDEQATIEALLL